VLLARVPSILFLLWAAIGTAIWWRDLRSPALFFVVAVLIGLGSQTVSSILLAMYKATSNQFIATPTSQAQSVLAYDLAFQIITTCCIAMPIYWLLSKRL
jgi:hypothetical protein